MAEQNKILEREYVIPLRRFWLRVPRYERTGKAIKAIKQFLAKHMKVEDRDVDKIKINTYLNNELWFRGRANPPAKVKVKATKENGIVKVDFVDTPDYVKFLKAKHEKKNKAAEKKAPVVEQKAEEKPEEQKKDEAEKEQAVAEQNTKQAEQQAKEMKHTSKPEKTTRPQRMALQK